MVFSIGQPTHFEGIYSKETNNSKVENYWPIVFSNEVYKFLPKVHTNRIKN